MIRQFRLDQGSPVDASPARPRRVRVQNCVLRISEISA
jgi:hypothetical protein